MPSKITPTEDTLEYNRRVREDMRKFRSILRCKLREVVMMARIAPDRARDISCLREEEGLKTRFRYYLNDKQLLSVEACRTESGVGVSLHYPKDLAV